MANLALVTTGVVRIVESIEQEDQPLAESCAVGDAVRIDTSAGTYTKSNGSSSGEARFWGMLVNVDGAGKVGTALRRGYVDGFDLSGMAFDADIYLSDTDGEFATSAGTVSYKVGRVVRYSYKPSGAADKLFYLDPA